MKQRLCGKVKWYGGYNRQYDNYNQYGYIVDLESNESLFAHKKMLICNESDMKEGTYVTYIIEERGGKGVAAKVDLLKREEAPYLIKQYAYSEEGAWRDVARQYLKSLEKVEEMEQYISSRACKDRTFIRGVTGELDDRYLMKSAYLRSLLYQERHATMLIQYFDRETVDYDELIGMFLKGEIRSDSILKELYKLFHIECKDYYKVLPECYLECMYNKENKHIENLREIEEFIRVKSVRETIWRFVDARLTKELDFFNELPLRYKINFLKDEKDESAEGIHKLKKCLELMEDESQKLELMGEYALEKLDADNVLKYISEQGKAFLIIRNYSVSIDKDTWIIELRNILRNSSPQQKENILKHVIQSEIKESPYIFEYLTPEAQVLVYEKSQVIRWTMLSNQSKVLYLYYHAQSYTEVKEEVVLSKNIRIINTMLDILLNYLDYLELDERVLFEKFDCNLNEIIIYNYEHKERIQLWPILPLCNQLSRLDYCEGKAWYSKEDKLKEDYFEKEASLVWCPRKRNKCSEIQNPRIYPRTELPWYKWSILEFLEICKIKPSLETLKDPREYTNKVCGWANRLEELRERSRCKKCNQVMQNDFGYAKRFDAAYRATIFNCSEIEFGHDHSIYMNHCWKCGKIIDSRESKIKIGGLYLCIRCGSGPQNTKYSVGDICPLCGEKHMIGEWGGYRCRKCNHFIEVKNDY